MLTVQTAPSVTANPSDQTVLAGGTASFTAAASGNPTPSVQWEVDTGSGYTDLSDEGVYSGSGSDTLTITGATAGMSGYQYEAVFSNGVGMPASTTTATLTVVPIPNIGTWNSAVDGLWDTAGNWSDTQGTGAPGFSGVSGDEATFNGAAGLNADLGNSSPSIAGLTFGPSALNYDIKSTGTGQLQLNNGDSNATITVSAGTQTIAAPVQLASNTVVNPAASATLNISGLIIGTTGKSLTIGDATHTGSLVEARTGAVSVAGATNVCAGALQVDGTWTTAVLNVAAPGGGQGSGHLAGSGTINLTSGGVLYYNSTAASTFAGDLNGSLSNARLEVDGGSLTLSGTNSCTGGTTVSAGTLILTNSSAIAASTSLTVGAGGIFAPSVAATPSTAMAATTPAFAGLADLFVTTPVASSNDTPATTAATLAAKAALQTDNLMKSVATSGLRAPAANRLFGSSTTKELVAYDFPDSNQSDTRRVPDWFFSTAVPRRTAGNLAWLAQVANSSSTSDQQQEKDLAVLALDAVLSQYGQ